MRKIKRLKNSGEGSSDYCPYCDEGAVARYVVPDHPDRKPNPGMLLRAFADLSIDPARSLVIGDRAADIEAGRRAGVRGALYTGGSLEAFVAKALATRLHEDETETFARNRGDPLRNMPRCEACA
jgi:D-glycero-D-manno-heptose 1,7-bisphosphate phosphatase